MRKLLLIILLCFIFSCQSETIKIKLIGFHKDLELNHFIKYEFNFKIVSENRYGEIITGYIYLYPQDTESINYYKDKIGDEYVVSRYYYWQNFSIIRKIPSFIRSESYGE